MRSEIHRLSKALILLTDSLYPRWVSCVQLAQVWPSLHTDTVPYIVLETTAYVPWGKLGQIGVLPVFLFHVTSERALSNVGEVAQCAHPFLNLIVNIPENVQWFIYCYLTSKRLNLWLKPELYVLDMLHEICPPRRLVLVAPVALVHIDRVLHMNLLLVCHKVTL